MQKAYRVPRYMLPSLRVPTTTNPRGRWPTTLGLLILLLLSTPLTGCGIITAKPAVVEGTGRVNALPEDLDKGQCKPEPPPSRAETKGKTDKEMVPILGKAWAKQTAVVVKCMDQIQTYKDYGKKMEAGAKQK